MAKQDGCLIGIDAGSSVIKAVAFDYQGNELCKHAIPIELSKPHPLWMEFDLNLMWKNVQTCLSNVAAQLKTMSRHVVGIGISSTGDGVCLIDKQGKPVRSSIMWCDGRTADIVERWNREKITNAAFDICGSVVFTGSQAAQLAWLREKEPEALQQATTIFHAKDWLFYKLTDQITSDETDESLNMLDMSTRRYDKKLFQIFHIEDLFEKFPPVIPTQENVAAIKSEVARELGFSTEVLIGSGPMDVAAGALGTGAIEHGQASTILGTAGIHQIIMDKPIIKPTMVGMTLCHGVKDRWLRMMPSMVATPSLDWFLQEFGSGGNGNSKEKKQDMYSRLEKVVNSVPAGSEGVLYHPYLFPGGERGPFVKPSARASFTGLSQTHSYKHLLRAVYEGVAFATLDCYRHMPVEAQSVHLCGGGANSDVWCQIIADCLSKSVKIPTGSEFGAQGVAINVGIAAGIYKDAADGVAQSVKMTRFFEPDHANTKVYKQLYEIYKMTYERQMDVWDRRAGLKTEAE